MSKNIIAFTIALVLHILVLGSSLFLINKNSTSVSTLSGKKVIGLQFGEGKSAPPSNINNKKGVNKNTSQKESPLQVSTTDSGSGGVMTGAGSASSGESFEGSIVNYEGPVYPKMAQKRGIEGNVRIRVKVSSEGLPESSNILQTSGHEILDQAALEVIPHWRFQKKDAAYFVEKNILFQLKN